MINTRSSPGLLSLHKFLRHHLHLLRCQKNSFSVRRPDTGRFFSFSNLICLELHFILALCDARIGTRVPERRMSTIALRNPSDGDPHSSEPVDLTKSQLVIIISIRCQTLGRSYLMFVFCPIREIFSPAMYHSQL